MIFDKEAKAIQWQKDVINNYAGTNEQPDEKKRTWTCTSCLTQN